MQDKEALFYLEYDSLLVALYIEARGWGGGGGGTNVYYCSLLDKILNS